VQDSQVRSVRVNADGTLAFVWDDELAELLELGPATVTRASHVEPTADGQWTADLSPIGGPVLGPFRLRREALAAEMKWLSARV
jgi:hypothetical protein